MSIMPEKPKSGTLTQPITNLDKAIRDWISEQAEKIKRKIGDLVKPDKNSETQETGEDEHNNTHGLKSPKAKVDKVEEKTNKEEPLINFTNLQCEAALAFLRDIVNTVLAAIMVPKRLLAMAANLIQGLSATAMQAVANATSFISKINDIISKALASIGAFNALKKYLEKLLECPIIADSALGKLIAKILAFTKVSSELQALLNSFRGMILAKANEIISSLAATPLGKLAELSKMFDDLLASAGVPEMIKQIKRIERCLPLVCATLEVLNNTYSIGIVDTLKATWNALGDIVVGIGKATLDSATNAAISTVEGLQKTVNGAIGQSAAAVKAVTSNIDSAINDAKVAYYGEGAVSGGSIGTISISTDDDTSSESAIAADNTIDEKISYVREGVLVSSVAINDTFGADGPAATRLVWDLGDGIHDTKYGSIVLYGTGEYSYFIINSREDVKKLADGETVTETFGYTIYDKDGDSASAVLTVTLQGGNNKVSLDAEEALLEIKEHSLITGDVSTSYITVSAPDGVASIKAVVDTTEEYDIPIDGTTKNIDTSDGTLTVLYNTIDSKLVYSYKLTRYLEGTKTHTVSFTVTDAKNSDYDTYKVEIQIDEDSPISTEDTICLALGYEPLTEDKVLTGNVLDNDTISANGTNTVVWLPQDGEFTTDYATVRLKSDGSYTYTYTNRETISNDVTIVEEFTYYIVDAVQNKSESSTLSIIIRNGFNEVSITNGEALIVDESDMATTASGVMIIDAPDIVKSIVVDGTAIKINGDITKITYDEGELSTKYENGSLTYTYKLTKAVTQDTEYFVRNLEVIVTDSDGSIATGEIEIKVKDAVPVAVNDEAVIARTKSYEISGSFTVTCSRGLSYLLVSNNKVLPDGPEVTILDYAYVTTIACTQTSDTEYNVAYIIAANFKIDENEPTTQIAIPVMSVDTSNYDCDDKILISISGGKHTVTNPVLDIIVEQES